MKYQELKGLVRLVLPVLSLLPTVAFGQESIKQAFGEFYDFANKQHIEYSENSDRQADPVTGELIDQSTSIIFSITQDNLAEKLISEMRQAFHAERDKSYDEFVRQGADMGVQPIIIGKENWIGSDPAANYIVMAFAEKKDNQPPTHRNVYAFEWRKEDKGISGKLVSSYGPIPAKQLKEKRNDNQGFGELTSQDYKFTIDALDSLISGNKLKDLMVALDSLTTDSDVMDAVRNLTANFIPGKNLNIGLSHDKEQKMSTSAWLNSFKQMCRSQMKYAKQGKSLTYFPTEILELSKSSGDLLTDEERQLCLKELDRVIAVTKDEFDCDLLEQARKHLSR